MLVQENFEGGAVGTRKGGLSGTGEVGVVAVVSGSDSVYDAEGREAMGVGGDGFGRAERREMEAVG
jgi:hypothetical protein